VLAVEAKFPSMAIAMPAGARAAEVTRLCGQCHKPRETALANPAATAAAARFQAATFPLSRCYDPAGTTLTCVTCHDPHRDSQPSTEFYTVKCHACHNSAESNPQASARACPVSPDKNCVACHMPKVESTSANTLFTDHHIRVHAN
jgi:ribosomal protein S27E